MVHRLIKKHEWLTMRWRQVFRRQKIKIIWLVWHDWRRVSPPFGYAKIGEFRLQKEQVVYMGLLCGVWRFGYLGNTNFNKHTENIHCRCQTHIHWIVGKASHAKMMRACSIRYLSWMITSCHINNHRKFLPFSLQIFSFVWCYKLILYHRMWISQTISGHPAMPFEYQLV